MRICVCVTFAVIIIAAVSEETGKATSVFRRIFSSVKMWQDAETFIVLKMQLGFF